MSYLILRYLSNGKLYLKRVGPLLVDSPTVFAAIVDSSTISNASYNTFVYIRDNITLSIGVVHFIVRPYYLSIFVPSRTIKLINDAPPDHEWYLYGIPSVVTSLLANWSPSNTKSGALNYRDTDGQYFVIPLSGFQFSVYANDYGIKDS